MSSTLTLEDLGSQLRGELISPQSAEYEDARKIYNAMIDKKPKLIARCRDVADVIAAVRYGRENNLLIAVRGGGHNVGGFALVDDGLVIDLSHMRWARVDAKAKTVRVGGGCQWGDVGSRDPRLWHGGSRRGHLDDGSRWTDVGRRDWVPNEKPRPPQSTTWCLRTSSPRMAAL